MKHFYLNNAMRKYCEDNQGQIAVWFAILALPLLAFTTYAVDTMNAEKEKTQLLAALDDAALAAVSRQNITDSERSAYATEYFFQNYDDRKDIEFEVLDSSSNRVELSGKTSVPITFADAAGIEAISIKQYSAAELTKGDIICMLVLDPDGDRSFVVTGGSRFTTQNCSVQVNSTSERAAVVEHGATATAKDFCVSGGAGDTGQYKPHVNTECSSVADPYINLVAPKADPCIDRKKVNETLDHFLASVEAVDLEPGTYCGGLELKSKVVNFLPGTYVIKDGPLELEDFTRATAQDVTFVFSGRKSTLKLGQGSQFDIKAPNAGPLAGLALYQDTSGRRLRRLPEAESHILDASGLRIIGTAYMPAQKVVFSGGALTASQAPATSFIAYNIEIREGSSIEVDVDHVAGDIPPILPRSDEGTRLTR